MNIIAITDTITAPLLQAFLEFISPSAGQVIELPNGKVLLNFTDDGEKRIAWIPQGATPAAYNVQTMRLSMADADELAIVRDLCNNPSKAKVLGHVACTDTH
jgi:hypothetical protein